MTRLHSDSLHVLDVAGVCLCNLLASYMHVGLLPKSEESQ